VSATTRRRRPDGLANYRPPPMPTLERIPVHRASRSEVRLLLDTHVAELVDAGVIKGRRDRIRVREDFARHVIAFYDRLRAAACRDDTGQGYYTWQQLAMMLYPDVETRDDAYRKLGGMVRWMRALEVVGLIKMEGVKDENGAWRCMRWQLLAVDSERRRRSSAGRAPLS